MLWAKAAWEAASGPGMLQVDRNKGKHCADPLESHQTSLNPQSQLFENKVPIALLGTSNLHPEYELLSSWVLPI